LYFLRPRILEAKSCFLADLGMKPRALCMLGKHYTSGL
jgi:hypothetical protein